MFCSTVWGTLDACQSVNLWLDVSGNNARISDICQMYGISKSIIASGQKGGNVSPGLKTLVSNRFHQIWWHTFSQPVPGVYHIHPVPTGGGTEANVTRVLGDVGGTYQHDSDICLCFCSLLHTFWISIWRCALDNVSHVTSKVRKLHPRRVKPQIVKQLRFPQALQSQSNDATGPSAMHLFIMPHSP